MADFLTKKQRSDLMSSIKGKGNKDTELALIKLFREHRITGWRRNQKVFGKPDFLFRRNRLALFVDGCFWHGCPRCYRRPESNRKFWDSKSTRNRERDREVSRELRRLGWHVMRVWEHVLAKQGEACIKRIQAVLNLSRSASR